ncbi:MAG TPA: putative 4-mercaptohistidine N1-methyltransferase [Chthoniobacteraceae bacterium]|nr:putative 4-mercaptohistidine N1-methyltransferase [Chthoniobacteraceae bacterium]
MQVYESERYLNEYLLFHYGEVEDVLAWDFGPADAVGFAARCVSDCIEIGALGPKTRALDLGCAVGRSSFELARYCTEVVGIDFSKSFIQAALEIRRHGQIHFDRPDEGMLSTRCAAKAPPDVDRMRVHFEIGDALKLRATLGDFDVVLGANLLCRLEDPIQLILKFSQLVRPGGQLILVSPYSWNRDFTPLPKWLGGYEREGRKYETFVTIQKFLEPDFDLIRTRDLPFLIREHARKYQWGVSHASVWMRRHG